MYLLVFFGFQFCTIGTKVRYTVFFFSLRGIFICFWKKTKVHHLIFNTYHTNGFNIPDLQPNYEYQYGMQQHLKLNVITLIQLYINTTRTLKYPKPSLNLLFVVGKVCFSG